MARVTIELPGLLAMLIQGVDSVAVEGSTLAEALDALYQRFPAMRVHIVDESGQLREHVLCFHNEVNTRCCDGDLDSIALGDDDTIRIYQCVSGG